MKIAFFDVFDSELNVLKNLLSNEDASFFEEKLSIDNVSKIKEAEVISVFIKSKIDKEIIGSLPNLKFIATRSTGYDHIDCAYAESKGIKISNVPAYGSNTVAEFAFALLLTLSRKVYDAYDNLKQGTKADPFSFQGFNLFGKTLGVIGTGKIGKNVVKIAKGFGMNVIAYDPYPSEDFAKEYNVFYKDLDTVLSEADVLTLHAPYTKENHHLINKEKISLMKKGIYIINTARGELIDTDALIWGLKENIIAGAGLDVLEGERELREEFETLFKSSRLELVESYKTLLEDHILIDMPNVIVTPHIAFCSKEATEEILKTTIENVKGFLDKNLINLVK